VKEVLKIVAATQQRFATKARKHKGAATQQGIATEARKHRNIESGKFLKLNFGFFCASVATKFHEVNKTKFSFVPLRLCGLMFFVTTKKNNNR
jgi:hypothetical protein